MRKVVKFVIVTGLSLAVNPHAKARHIPHKHSPADPDVFVHADEGPPPTSAAGVIRFNQTGYGATEAKIAVLLSAKEASGKFTVTDAKTGKEVFSASIPQSSLGKWSRSFAFSYALDFSSLAEDGTFFLRVSAGALDVSSPQIFVRPATEIFNPLLDNALAYFRTNRDGDEIDPHYFNRVASHLNDRTAIVYETPPLNGGTLASAPKPTGETIDATGGWFDAGDYLKFVETESYVAGVMLFSLREYPKLRIEHAQFLDEARFGLKWLLKMWNQNNRTLYYQTGIGDGTANGSILGDHAVWRLPETDDGAVLTESPSNYFVKFPPVFRAAPAGSQISPNLAGRLAAAFALGFQIFQATDPDFANGCLLAAETIFDMAKTENVGELLTASNFGFYPESEWRDDLEWASAELYLALDGARTPRLQSLPHEDKEFYFDQAKIWAGKYLGSENHLKDTFNLYDVSALAHFELIKASKGESPSDELATLRATLTKDLADQLDLGLAHSKKDPFGFAMAYNPSDDPAPHAVGFAITAGFYRALTGLSTYDNFGRAQRDWLLGKNAWGSSFIIGAGETSPQHPSHQIANLVRDNSGKAQSLLGGVVSGFTSDDEDDPPGPGMIVDADTDRFSAYDKNGALYRDKVTWWATVEPAIDYTAPTILLFSQQLE